MKRQALGALASSALLAAVFAACAAPAGESASQDDDALTRCMSSGACDPVRPVLPKTVMPGCAPDEYNAAMCDGTCDLCDATCSGRFPICLFEPTDYLLVDDPASHFITTHRDAGAPLPCTVYDFKEQNAAPTEVLHYFVAYCHAGAAIDAWVKDVNAVDPITGVYPGGGITKFIPYDANESDQQRTLGNAAAGYVYVQFKMNTDDPIKCYSNVPCLVPPIVTPKGY